MNTKLIAGLSTLLIGLSACTTTPQPAADHSVDTLTNVERYQASVQAQALRKNVHVHWVNPPDEEDLKKYSSETTTNGNVDID